MKKPLTGAAHRRSRFFFSFLALSLLLAPACTILTTRPAQLMSDTGAAIRAAREAQADTLAPELYRQANEWFFRAKQEYKLKNFKLATDYATKARVFAEQAEFHAIKNATKSTDHPAPPTAPEEPPPPPPQ